VADNVIASIRATCERCGTIDVPASDARLGAAADDDVRDEVVFRCPRCGEIRSVRVDERTSRLLAATSIAVLPPAGIAPDRHSSGTPGSR